MLAVSVGFAGCGAGDGEDSATTTTTVATAPATEPTTTTEAVHVIEVVVEGGQPQGGVRREEVALGAVVRIVVTSDVADEVHVHTYDVRADVAAGGRAELELVADIPGVIEVELEERHTRILTLEVRP